MERLATDSDITLFSRYECKYLVSPVVVPELRAFLSPFVRPDGYAARSPDSRYPICSLYLDSDDLCLYQQTVGGDKNRFKLRARTYAEHPSASVFLEVKRKINNIVQKRRVRLDRRQVDDVLGGNGNAVADALPPDLRDDLLFYLRHASSIEARPVLRVKYLREAYESTGGDPVRVTLDTELMHAVTFGPDLAHSSGRWVRTPVAGVILELKFTERFPSWIRDLVRTFDLRQQSVPKYIWSLDHLLLDGREAVTALSGFTLPPRRA